jgi:tRNA A37 methylthiotransferase MiaB
MPKQDLPISKTGLRPLNIFIMYTTYHLRSPQEINNDIIEAIKAAFKGKPITLTIEEDNDETAFLMANPKNREMLLKSIAQDKNGEFVSVKIEGE